MNGLWVLTYRDDPVAIRFHLRAGAVHDVELGKFSPDLLSRLPLDMLPRLPLAPHVIKKGRKSEELLITADEARLGRLVEGYSRTSPKDLEFLVHRFDQYFRTNPPEYIKNPPPWYEKTKYQLKQEQEKLLKKRNDLRKEFYRIVPLKQMERFVDYHLQHFEGNNNIYNNFNAEQLKLVRDYFRWSSRIIFYRNGERHVLRINPKKAEKLAAIMQNVDDWRYDGTVDTGFVGGGHCELGHALRYEHYAVSPSLNVEIVFGEKCASDFFSVDQSVLREIVAIQNRLVNELKYIVFLRANKDLLEEHLAKYKDELWATLGHFKGRFNEITAGGAGYASFIGGFHKLRLPLTPTLLGVLESWVSRKQRETASPEAKSPDVQQSKPPAASQPESKSESKAPQLSPEDQFKSAYQKRLEAQASRVEGMGIVNVLLDPTFEPQGVDDYIVLIDSIRKRSLIPATTFGFQVIETVRRYRKISPNQKKYLDDLLNKAREQLKKRLVEQNSPSPKIVNLDEKQPASKPQTPPPVEEKEDEVDHSFTQINTEDDGLPF